MKIAGGTTGKDGKDENSGMKTAGGTTGKDGKEDTGLGHPPKTSFPYILTLPELLQRYDETANGSDSG